MVATAPMAAAHIEAHGCEPMLLSGCAGATAKLCARAAEKARSVSAAYPQPPSLSVLAASGTHRAAHTSPVGYSGAPGLARARPKCCGGPALRPGLFKSPSRSVSFGQPAPGSRSCSSPVRCASGARLPPAALCSVVGRPGRGFWPRRGGRGCPSASAFRSLPLPSLGFSSRPPCSAASALTHRFSYTEVT